MITLLRQDTGDDLSFLVVQQLSESFDGQFNADTNVDRREISRGYTDRGRPVAFTAVVGPTQTDDTHDLDRVARTLAWLEEVRGGGPAGDVLITYQRRNRAPRVDLAVESFNERMMDLNTSEVSVVLRVQNIAVESTVSAPAFTGTAPVPSQAAQDQDPQQQDVGARSTSLVDDLWQRAEVGFLRSGAAP